MEIIEAIILGLVQGLTEFLPVSSTGHLELTKKIFEIKLSGSANIAFDIVAHAGSAIAILIFFIREFMSNYNKPDNNNVKQGHNFLSRIRNSFSTKFISSVIVASIPAVLVYLIFKDYINIIFESSVVVAVSLIATGVFLIFIDFINDKHDSNVPVFAKPTSKNGNLELAPNEINKERRIDLLPFTQAENKSVFRCWLASAIIGLFQAIAILPGISRSGFTIGGGLIMRLSREQAVRFSFILGFVAIFGGLLLELKNIHDLSSEISSEILLITFFTSLISSLLALQMIIWVVRVRRLKYFGFYCFVIAILSLNLIA